MITMVRLLLQLFLVWTVVSFIAATASLSTEETPEDLCEAYCIEYHAELACPNIDIYSKALASNKAPRKDPVDIPKCVSACLKSGMRFDGTLQDFDNANTIQCRRNHIIMQIQEKTLSNTDHCLHAMIRGGQRCDPKDPSTQVNTLIRGTGEEFFWNPDSKLGLLIPPLTKWGLAAVYEGSLRQRLMTSYPYIEIPSDGRICASPNDTKYRTVDGSCNHPEMPKMGATGTQFIQLFPPSKPHPDPLPNVADVAEMIKRPRVIDESRLAPFSQICVAWIQFMTHDWFQHGKFMPGNIVTHWWDGSMLYGSTQAEADNVRTVDGKLKLDDDDEIEYVFGNTPRTGFSLNWWAGLHVMHTIFAREHNYVVDQLEVEYPLQYSVEEKFQIARLCLSALMAKIHTIEWTPTLLDNPGASVGLNANWRGAEEAILDYGTQLEYEIGSKIIGGYWVPYAGNTEAGTEVTLYNTTFQMIEEFVAVYRMHPLLPDALQVGETTFSLKDLTFTNPRNLVPDDTTEKFLRAFGEQPALTLSLQNYPRELYDLVTPGGTVINLAEIDLTRDRERGLPRYNDMRRLLLLKPHKSIDDLTNDKQERAALKSVYTDIEQVELMVGSLVDQDRPAGFAFGIIAYHIFIAVASRRILCDRFYMEDFNPDLYTEWGYNHVQTETLRTVLVRHFPDLEDEMPDNPFLNWGDKGKK